MMAMPAQMIFAREGYASASQLIVMMPTSAPLTPVQTEFASINHWIAMIMTAAQQTFVWVVNVCTTQWCVPMLTFAQPIPALTTSAISFLYATQMTTTPARRIFASTEFALTSLLFAMITSPARLIRA